MLLSLLRDQSMSALQKILFALIIALCVLLSISIHELSHGLAAYLMGDTTAKSSGRLSLNPLHHIDIFGAICLFLFGFGWAKPVPVNPRRFKSPKLGMAITSLAGPLSNFILAFIASIFVVLLSKLTFSSNTSFTFNVASVTYMICQYLVIINIGLGLFNLIPIPPLDGSKILLSVLPERWYFGYMQFERFGFIVLILLINLPFFNSWLSIARNAVISFYDIIISTFI